MSAEKPTILVVPGAWLPIINYADYITALEAEGFPVIATTYPSLSPSDPSTADCKNDSLHIGAKVDDVLSYGKELVIISHSYGSLPASGAAKGKSIVERRKEGKVGGVIGLICVASFLVPEGSSCAESWGGKIEPWILTDNPSKGLNVADDPVKMFSADQSADYNKRMLASLKPFSTLAFWSPQPPAAHLDPAFKGRLGYQITTQDIAVPLSGQHGVLAGTGVNWIKGEIDGSHMAPFGTHIAESVNSVKSMIAQFQRL